MIKARIAELIQNRDKEFIARFCSEGAYMDEEGNIINGICRQVDAQEMLNFQHVHDALILDALNVNESD